MSTQVESLSLPSSFHPPTFHLHYHPDSSVVDVAVDGGIGDRVQYSPDRNENLSLLSPRL